MLGNKLFGILQGFSRKEMTRFYEFAFSPYFNKHKGVRQLVTYLSEIYPDFDEKSCSRRFLLKQMAVSGVKNQSQLAVIFTYTFRLVEQFLVQERFKEETPFHNLLLLKDHRGRKNYALYDKTLEQAERQLSKQRLQDSHFFNEQYQLAREADFYHQQIQKRQKDLNIQLKQNNLDYFYLSEKLKDACEMHFRTKILKVNYNTGLLDAVIREVEANLEEYGRVPAINMYYKLYLMVVHENHPYYFEAFETLNRNNEKFSLQERKYIYNYFQNYCIQQINQGKALFLKEIFKLYQSQLEQNLLIEEGFLSEWHYKNIVTTGIRLQEMDWVIWFIDHYRSRLRPEARDNAYMFNLASYYYATQQLDKVLDLLIKVEYNDLRYNLGAKALLLRTYYDLEENDALFSLADSFKQYLQRNKLMADSRREGYHNLFRLTRKAALIRANLDFVNKGKNLKEIEKLQRDFEQTNPIFNQDWLKEKIREIQIEIE